jgi:transposase
LRDAFAIGADSAAEMMIVAGDNPTRVRSEAAFAKLCGACPIPASSGVTHRPRLFRGGHRQANAALYRIVTVRMRWHQPTLDYVARRTAQARPRQTSSAASSDLNAGQSMSRPLLEPAAGI